MGESGLSGETEDEVPTKSDRISPKIERRSPDALLPGQPERRSPERRRSPDALLPGKPEIRRSPDALLPGQPERRRSPDALLPGQPERRRSPEIRRSPDASLPVKPERINPPLKNPDDPPVRKPQSILPGIEVSAPEDDRSAKRA